MKGIALSLLLTWSLLAGQCALCRHAQAPVHDCCQPAKPESCHGSGAQQQCPGHGPAFETYSKVETPSPAGAVQPVCETSPAPAAAPAAASGLRSEHAQPPPPERFLLTTVLLI